MPTPKQILDDMLKRAKGAPHGLVAEVHEIDHDWGVEMRRRNTNNRKISKANVRRYRADAENGRWTLNGQAVVFSNDGVLADGQHRGEALIDTAAKVLVLVVAGIAPEARVTMDQGRSRNAGDDLTMLGEETGNIAGTMIRYLMAFEANKREDLKGLAKASRAQILEFFKGNKARVRKSAELALELREPARYHVAAPMLAFLHHILSEENPEKAEIYIRQVAKGEGLKDEDPAYVVREKLIALGRVNGTKKAEIILSGWKPFLEGRKLSKIRIQGRLPGI